MYNLGVLLADSDPGQARRWYRQAAEAGDPDAMISLGVLLERVTRARPAAGIRRPPKPGTLTPCSAWGCRSKRVTRARPAAGLRRPPKPDTVSPSASGCRKTATQARLAAGKGRLEPRRRMPSRNGCNCWSRRDIQASGAEHGPSVAAVLDRRDHQPCCSPYHPSNRHERNGCRITVKVFLACMCADHLAGHRLSRPRMGIAILLICADPQVSQRSSRR